MTIGEQIKKYRKKNKLTQKELGELLGLSGVAIMRYEKNQRTPTIETLKKMSEIFNVPLLMLIHPDELALPEILDTEELIDIGESDKLFEKYKLQILESHFEKLNNRGKDIAIERVEELTKISDYTKKKES